jgi:uncharacterized protein (TIGR03435 family)
VPVRRFAAVLLCIVAMAIAPSIVARLVGQDSAARFEVASVKPNVSADLTIPIRPLPPDGIVLTNFPLYEVIRYAYDVQPFRLEGTPGWTHDERFDIAAKAAAKISDTERRLMMRTLLVERFHLKSRMSRHVKRRSI